jgi:preprotein translocase subunit SecD
MPEVLIVAKSALLEDWDVKEAKAGRNPMADAPQIAITLTEQGRKAFAEVTRTNLNRRLAILIDGKPLLAPVIRSEIPNGQVILTGNFSEKEAVELAARLNRAVRQRNQRERKPWRHGLYDAR